MEHVVYTNDPSSVDSMCSTYFISYPSSVDNNNIIIIEVGYTGS